MLTRRDVLYQFGAAGAALLALRSGASFGAIAPQTPVRFDVPPGACDSHVHVFDPKFPLAERRVYTPPPATVEDLLELQRALRFDRVVLVQPSVYGTDNSCHLDALRQLGPRARGVMVIGKDTSQTELDDWAGIGVRGVRLNLETIVGGAFDAAAAKAVLDNAVEKLRGRNWHIQIYTRLSVLTALKEQLAQLPLPVVVDHFGRAVVGEGPDQAGFDTLLDLVKSGRAYVKISAAHRMEKTTELYPEVTSLAQALVAANPDRVLWGTDWPHVNSAYGRTHGATAIAPPIPIDNGLVLNQLAAKWVPEPAIRRKILVENPARLYGFGVPLPEAEIPTGTVRVPEPAGASR
jgi:predicted TIM-barrel fold metal-dependent hydrolase